jgi:hypothetical protein
LRMRLRQSSQRRTEGQENRKRRCSSHREIGTLFR